MLRENTYESDKSWRRLQRYLPKRNRLTRSSLPAEEYITVGNFRVHADHYLPAKPLAQVLIIHGVGGNGRLLSFIAVPLYRLGYEVICPDLPLYGLTTYGRTTVSYKDWETVAEQVAGYYRTAGLPLFLFGLSAGGLLAYETACRVDNARGLIATCLLDQRIPEVTRATANNPVTAIAGKPFLKAVHKLIGNLKLPMKSVCNMDAIVNNEAVRDILVHDRLASGASVTLEFLYGMLKPELTIEPEVFDKCPVLFTQPEKDRWTEEKLSRLFFDKLPVNKERVLLPGAGHFPIEEEGLLALEKSCDEFMQKSLKG